MKELSIEGKAKAYDELIKRLNKAREDVGGYTFKSVYDEVMSELAESEDEKFLRYLIDCCKDTIESDDKGLELSMVTTKRLFAWLEKQGEQIDIANKEYWRGYREGKQEILDKYAELEKQGEPVISEDALREGIAHFGITQYQIDNWLKKYVDVEKQGEQKPIDTKNLETAISNMLKVYSHIILHRSLTQDELNETDVYAAENTKNLLCFLEQKPAWSEEDEKILSNIIKDLVHPWNEYIPDRIEEEIKWLKNKLKSLKDKCLPQPQQEWSEGDKVMLDEIIDFFENGTVKLQHDLSLYASWLKSLRPQWKPNEEMLEALYRAIPKNVMEISEDEMLLDKLYQGLKYGRVLSEK